MKHGQEQRGRSGYEYKTQGSEKINFYQGGLLSTPSLLQAYLQPSPTDSMTSGVSTPWMQPGSDRGKDLDSNRSWWEAEVRQDWGPASIPAYLHPKHWHQVTPHSIDRQGRAGDWKLAQTIGWEWKMSWKRGINFTSHNLSGHSIGNHVAQRGSQV